MLQLPSAWSTFISESTHRGIVRTMNGHGDLCAFDDTTGAQITQKGWLKKGTSYYWVREDGVLQTGWLLYDDNWYWFDDNGVMMTSGWKEINNNLYYFRSCLHLRGEIA